MALALDARHVRDDLGRRIELVSMDAHREAITIALYRRADGKSVTVHSYSGKSLVGERLDWIVGAMAVLGGLDVASDAERALRFGCGTLHELAVRRVFLEACKPDPAEPVEVRPLSAPDLRTSQRFVVEPRGGGSYRVVAEGVDPGVESRAGAVAIGYAKLAAMTVDTADPTIVTFPCGTDHHALVGLLLKRAINVRAALREMEAAASRGILVAPSQQAAQEGS